MAGLPVAPELTERPMLLMPPRDRCYETVCKSTQRDIILLAMVRVKLGNGKYACALVSEEYTKCLECFFEAKTYISARILGKRSVDKIDDVYVKMHQDSVNFSRDSRGVAPIRPDRLQVAEGCG